MSSVEHHQQMIIALTGAVNDMQPRGDKTRALKIVKLMIAQSRRALREAQHEENARQALLQKSPFKFVSAEQLAKLINFSESHINSLASRNEIPWIGCKNGTKVTRRFNPVQVIITLSHGPMVSTTQKQEEPKK